MALSDACAEKLCGVAIAGGAMAASAVIGLPLANGLIEFLTGGGQLALAVGNEQRRQWDGYIRKVRKRVASDYGAWLEAECGSDWQQRADVEAALSGLDREIAEIRPSAMDIAVAGHNSAHLVTLLLHRLPATSLFRTSDTAAGIFAAVVVGAFNLVRSDNASLAELSSFSFERVFVELDAIRAQLTNADRVQLQILESQQWMAARMLDERGIHPRNLERIFREIGRDPDIPPDRYEAELASAIEALIARAADPVKALNDTEAVVEAIRAARRMLARFDVEGALARLQAQEDEERSAMEGRRRGAVRLMVERADILRELFRHDAAITLYDEAATLDPDNLYSLRGAGRSRLGNRPLAEVLAAFERFRDAAARVGDNREVSVADNEIGDVLVAQGRLDEALARYRDGLAVRERLAAADPSNTGWQRDLSASFNRIGDVLVAQGRLDEALSRYRDGLALAERLAAADPSNTEWQRDLSVSFNRIGDVLVAQGRLDEALSRYRDGLAVRERLAAADPSNTQWQRDLSISFNRIGDVLVAEGRLHEALSRYRDGLAVAERLAAADPSNTAWQRDLSISFNKIGDVLVAEGRLDEALARFRDGLALAERLAAADPSNTAWQRDLSISFNKIGDVLVAQGRLDEALSRYRDGLAVRERLVAADPSNTGWQRDLSASFNRIGDVLVAQGRLDEALSRYRDGLALAERLAAADPSNTEWQRDLSVSFNRIGDVLVAQGRLDEALSRYRDGLAVHERLAAADPSNTLWQRDLVVSCVKLAGAGPDKAPEHLIRALKIATELAASGRLAPADAWMPDDLKRRLAGLHQAAPDRG